LRIYGILGPFNGNALAQLLQTVQADLQAERVQLIAARPAIQARVDNAQGLFKQLTR